ncbi:MAG: Yip1 family protein [Methanocellales archaeon]
MDLNKVRDRALSIVKNPLTELTKVKAEEIKPMDLITQYIAILAVIPAIATIIGWGFVGVGFFRYSIIAAIVGGILTYILSIAGVYISGIVINTLAPNFASKQSDVQAMKLAAYAATPGLLGGIFNIIPMLSILAFLCSLYGLYILYLGIPVLMETPKDKVLIYTIAVIVVMIVIYFIIGAITGTIMTAMSPMPYIYR